jgi:hypothetical protein
LKKNTRASARGGAPVGDLAHTLYPLCSNHRFQKILTIHTTQNFLTIPTTPTHNDEFSEYSHMYIYAL